MIAFVEYRRTAPYCSDPAYNIYPHTEWVGDRALLAGIGVTVVGVALLLRGAGQPVFRVRFRWVVVALALLNFVGLVAAALVGGDRIYNYNLCP